ncbi:MAG: tetratricopeptide repeat protein [Rhodospirillales bacterium]
MSNSSTNRAALKRYILWAGALTFAAFTLWSVLAAFVQGDRGRFALREGDIALDAGDFPRALERFETVLVSDPHHLGAAMGRAIALLQLGRMAEAETAFDAVIADLRRRQGDEVRRALSVALANRAILKDRSGRHEEALADYIKALESEAAAVAGPGLVDRLIYANPNPSTVRDRARYLYEELQKPEGERVLSLPERDARERMYRP